MARAVIRAAILFLILGLGATPASALPPNAVDDFIQDAEDTIITDNVLGNDVPDVVSPLVVVSHDGPGEVTIGANGDLTYNPVQHFGGEITFNYRVLENDPACLVSPPAECFDTAQVIIQTLAVADDPVLLAGPVSGDEDTTIPLGITLTEVDTDGSQTLRAQIVDVPAGASLTAGADQGGGVWNVSVNDLASLGIALPANFNGSGVTLTVSVDVVDEAFDGSGGLINQDTSSVKESINVTVNEVNDAPIVVGSIDPVTVDEDAEDTTIDLSGLFDDIDIATSGDSLSLSVTSVTNGSLFSSAFVSGQDLTLAYAPDQNGFSTVTVTATDSGANPLSVDYDISVTVNAVNDPPVVLGALPDITFAEDMPPAPFSIDVFEDVDIVTNGDVLTFSVESIADPSLFSTVSITGDMMTLISVADANGSSEITVRATDSAGTFVEDTFLVTVVPVNDAPIANNDAVVIDEDSGPITLSVLDNDHQPDPPTVLSAVGATGEHTVLDAFDNPITSSNGLVSISGSDIIYEPTANFFGTDTFTYTISDADGDTSTATVTVTVNPINDPPQGSSLIERTMSVNQTLIVEANLGVLAPAFDIDGLRLDESGVPLGSVLVAQIETLPPVGTLNINRFDGSFTYTPPLNYLGSVEFTYRLFDNETLSDLPAYTVRIEIEDVAPPAPPPTPGEVATPYNLSQVPLEASATVRPNVLVVMDDSGSMDWNVIVEGNDENGGYLLSNDSVANGRVVETSYVYLWDLPTNTYPPNNEFGRVLPTEDSLIDPANDDYTDNNYEVWRGRSSEFNRLYYNPEIEYKPWIGLDEDSLDFADAVPNAIRLDPVDADDTFDMLAPHSYEATGVPDWDANGGSGRVDVDGLYIPFYYGASQADKIVIDDPLRTDYPGGANRDDCRGDGNPLTCTYEQELQNFANWFQYYRTREYVTKGSMGSVVAQTQDIRIGYETISATTSENVAEMNDLYSEGEKRELLDNIYSVDSFGGTPLRQALGRAGQILGCRTGSDCPALPEPERQCQQNFALLFSDGYWNGGTGVSINADEDGPRPFDGGRYADNVSQTLADVAMFYYENDLFPTTDDGVPIGIRDITGAPAGTFDGVDTMHQHMKTYTIAFGAKGTLPPAVAQSHPVETAFAWTDPFAGNLEKIDDMLHAAVNGRGTYLSAGNPQELQSALESAFLEFTQAASSASAAAFNSTSLRDGTLLYRSFYDLRNRTGELTATLVSTEGVLATNPTWIASEQLDTVNPVTANGRILVTYNPAIDEGVPFRYNRLAAVQQSTMTEAEVRYMRGERTGIEQQFGGSYRDRELTRGLLGPIVNSSPVFVGRPRAFNRDQAPYPTDDLYSNFANTVGSRTPVVYVGSNDGMLHGFNASTGQELFGYVPNKILDASSRYSNKLNEFTRPFYAHNYYVDLSPRLNDVYMRPTTVSSKQWMTTLIGGLGAGGKGFFALNVNDPDTTFGTEAAAAQSVLWEFTDEDDTYPLDASGLPLGGAVGAITDPNGDPVKDLGYAVSVPLVQMTNADDGGSPANKEWAAIFGNGANSTSGIAKLFVLFMDRGIDGWGDSGDFVKVGTGFGVPLPGEQLEGYPNALGTPTSIDADLDGTVDYVYAGDRIGNLFRFDLTSENPDDWFAVRLFTATYNDGAQDVVQPIQERPLVVKNPDGVGFIVIFGTGSMLTSDDSREAEIQSIYGIWDRLTNNPATADVSTKTDRLVEQTITNVVDDSGAVALTRRIVTNNSVDLVADGVDPGTYGWYIDLDMPRATDTLSGAVNPDTSGEAPPAAQFPGEKAVRRLVFRNGAVITTTVLPATNETSCLGARPGSVLLFNAFSGGDAVDPVIDFNGDNVVDENDLVDVAGESFSGGLLFNQNDLDGSLVDLSTLGGSGDTDFLFVSGGNETISYRIAGINDGRTGRLSWIELDDAE